MSSENCIFTRCFYEIALPPLPGSSDPRIGFVLTLLNLRTELPKFIAYFNEKFKTKHEIKAKSEEIYRNLGHNMDHCFPNNDYLRFDFMRDEESINTPPYKQKIYSFLLDQNLNIVSSLSVHFFRDRDGQKFYSKIYDVCVAQNQSGTKILMLEILKRIKPISQFIWLNVLPDNEKAYNLYLDIGFEFVFNNKTDLLDMIYVEKNVISSRNNIFLTNDRKNDINDMVNYKIYRNYINRIGDTLVSALLNDNEQYTNNSISDFMTHVYNFLNPSSEEMDTDEGHILKKNRLSPVLRFTMNNITHFLFINSLVNNISFDQDLFEDFKKKLLDMFTNKNIVIEDLRILFRTLFIIKKPVTIITDIRGRYYYRESMLNLNLFVIINENEITSYPNLSINRSSDIYNIEINNPNEINNIDIHIKNAIYTSYLHSADEIPKICIKISKNIDLDLRTLYYTYNLLPSYSACPYKPNTFVYNIKRFNNINNRLWELDNFNFNNLYVLPNASSLAQPITKDILYKISGCNNLPDSLESYFIQYLDYLNPSMSILIDKKVLFRDIGEGIFLSFLGYLIYRCNVKFIDQMLADNNLNLNLSNRDDVMRWIHMTPFLTLNYYDFDRIKPDLIHNINIFCHTRTIDYMCSNSHGTLLLNQPRRLERGQKLIMYTRPGNLFYMNNLNYNFLSLIFDTNNVQKLFNCIELLNNSNIKVSTFIYQYRDIIEALLANNSYTDSDVFMYTEQYYDHALTYNEEVNYWVNYPIKNSYFYHYLGNFRVNSPTQIVLTDNIDAKINSNFSLNGSYVYFNTYDNNINNRVSGFDFTTKTLTFTENIPVGASRVLISNLIYQFQYRTTREFYNNIVMDSNLYNVCNRLYIINYLDGINDRINDLISNYNQNDQNIYTNNFDTNTNTFNNLSNRLYIILNNVNFRSQSNIPSDAILRKLSGSIIFRKLIEGCPHLHDKRLSIETNTNITLNNFTKRDTHNLHVKEYTNPNITINLSTLLDKKMKYNSFVCCRGVDGVNAPINIPRLAGEIRVRDILTYRKPELDLFF